MGSHVRFRRGLITLLLLFSPITIAASPPSWINKAFWEDADHYYYVGVATNAPSEEEGRIQAHERALAEAIQHLFGIQTTMSRRAFISNDNLVVDEDLAVQLPKSFLVGVRVVDQYIERDLNGINVWRMIAVSKDKSLLFNDDTPKIFNRYTSHIGKDSLGRGKLRVKTDPINSQIFLDGEPIGKSNGEFENIGAGKYKLRAEKGGYEPITREILISPDSATELSLLLKPQLIPIEIKTNPSGASVYNGESLLGETPLSISLSANTHRLKVEKEHFEPTIVQINATEEGNKSHSLDLIPLPGKLLIQTSPTGGSVYSATGKPLGATPLFLEKYPAGKHQFIFELQGFPLSSQSIEIKPEESTELHHSFNAFDAEDDNSSAKRENKSLLNPIIFGRSNLPLDSAPTSMNPSNVDKKLLKINKILAVDNLVEEVAKSGFRDTKINGSRLAFWNYVKERAVFLPPSYSVKKDKYYLTTFAKIDLSPFVTPVADPN